MALNFPDSPTLGQVYTDSISGFSYEWNGTVWISYSPSSSSQIQTIDDISASFNGVTQSFALTSNATAITPASAQSLIINLGGVVQDPTDDYSVSGSNIIFSTPPTGGLTFSGVSLGPAIPVNTIPNGTVTDGSLRISTTAVVGSATTFTEDLVVSGDARITGILTVGTSSITLDGSTNTITVGSGLTISPSGITGTASSVTSASVSYGLLGTPNLNVGIITATTINASSFVGNGSGLTGAGSTVANDTSTNSTFYPLFTSTTSGTVTASRVSTTKLTFNPSTGTLSATTFSGALSGNSTTATTLQTARTINGVSFNGSADIVVNPTTGAYSNGQGAKIIQSGGTASGGSSGDIYYIY